PRTLSIEVLPAPLRPTRPTFSPGATVKSTFSLRTTPPTSIFSPLTCSTATRVPEPDATSTIDAGGASVSGLVTPPDPVDDSLDRRDGSPDPRDGTGRFSDRRAERSRGRGDQTANRRVHPGQVDPEMPNAEAGLRSRSPKRLVVVPETDNRCARPQPWRSERPDRQPRHRARQDRLEDRPGHRRYRWTPHRRRPAPTRRRRRAVRGV